MKFSCEKQDLINSISNISRAVSSKSSIPALEGVLLKAEENKLVISGYDLEIGMTTEIPAMVTETGSVVLNAKLFSDIIRSLPEDTVSFDSDEKNLIVITSGASEFSITGISADEYPEFPIISDTVSVSISHKLLKSMIRQTIYAVAENDTKNPVHMGTLFEISGGYITLVSVDGIRLAVRKEKIATQEEFSFVVPGKTLSEVAKLLKDDDTDAALRIEKRHILFEIGNYVVLSRLLEGDFIDYKAVIPKENATQMVLQTRRFMESVERVSLLINDRRRIPVRCIFEDDMVRISCETEIGRANDQFPAQISGNTVEMGFNNKYLLDALRYAEDDEVRVCLNGPFSPMTIVPKDGDAFLFLVLPVRL